MRLPNKRHKNSFFYRFIDGGTPLLPITPLGFAALTKRSDSKNPLSQEGFEPLPKPPFTDHPTLLAKRASNHSPNLSPIVGKRLKLGFCRNRKTLLCFGIAGHAMSFLSATAMKTCDGVLSAGAMKTCDDFLSAGALKDYEQFHDQQDIGRAS